MGLDDAEHHLDFTSRGSTTEVGHSPREGLTPGGYLTTGDQGRAQDTSPVGGQRGERPAGVLVGQGRDEPIEFLPGGHQAVAPVQALRHPGTNHRGGRRRPPGDPSPLDPREIRNDVPRPHEGRGPRRQRGQRTQRRPRPDGAGPVGSVGAASRTRIGGCLRPAGCAEVTGLTERAEIYRCPDRHPDPRDRRLAHSAPDRHAHPDLVRQREALEEIDHRLRCPGPFHRCDGGCRGHRLRPPQTGLTPQPDGP